jgi:hypothetical protein
VAACAHRSGAVVSKQILVQVTVLMNVEVDVASNFSASTSAGKKTIDAVVDNILDAVRQIPNIGRDATPTKEAVFDVASHKQLHQKVYP